MWTNDCTYNETHYSLTFLLTCLLRNSELCLDSVTWKLLSHTFLDNICLHLKDLPLLWSFMLICSPNVSVISETF